MIPGPIRQVVDAWRAAGSPSQEGIEWPREGWVAAFPVHAAMFTALPGPPRSHRRPLWSTSAYARYLEAMFGWADELGLAADELELCIFSTQAGLGESQWAPR